MRLPPLLIAFLMALPLSGCAPDGPEETAKTFVRHIASGETAQAVALVDPEVLELMGRGELESWFSQAHRQLDAEGMKLETVTVTGVTLSEEGNRAEITLELLSTGGQRDTETLYLERMDGEWRIDLRLM